VTVRGSDPRMFRDTADRDRFLACMARSSDSCRVRICAFCLLEDHFHLVLITPNTNLGRFMQSIQTAYAVYYNRRHGRSGHVVRGRYTARIVDEDEHLLRLTRHLHLNPVHKGSVTQLPVTERITFLRNYPWSSYPAYAHRSRLGEFIDRRPVLRLLRETGREHDHAYRDYVESAIERPDEELRETILSCCDCIGKDGFKDRINRIRYDLLARNGRSDREIRRLLGPCAVPVVDIMAVLSRQLGVPEEAFMTKRRNSLLRPVAASMLSRYGGLTNRETADALHMGTGAAAGKRIARLNELMNEDKNIAKLVKSIRDKLDSISGPTRGNTPRRGNRADKGRKKIENGRKEGKSATAGQ
jgi:putative transposase